MNTHFDTGPFAIAVQTVIDSQPYADEPRPWLRATLRTLACWATGAAVGALLFLAYTHAGG